MPWKLLQIVPDRSSSGYRGKLRLAGCFVLFNFHPPSLLSFLLSFLNRDIHLFIGSHLVSALITLPTLNSLQTLKRPPGFHMEESHPLHFSGVLKVASQGARQLLYLPRCPRGRQA